jgi:putative resolvase
VIVVERRDPLARFGVECVEAALPEIPVRWRRTWCRDMAGVLTSFCARLYGKRAARNRAKKALAAAWEEGEWRISRV